MVQTLFSPYSEYRKMKLNMGLKYAECVMRKADDKPYLGEN